MSTVTTIEGNVATHTTYYREYEWRDNPGGGFLFPCEPDGSIDTEGMYPPAVANLEMCRADGGARLIDRGVRVFKETERLCSCGSQRTRHALYDARGIFCAYYCRSCEQTVKARYRRDVLVNPNYECDEQVEECY